MRQIAESSGRPPVMGVPLVVVARPRGEDLTSEFAVQYVHIVLIRYAMTDRSQVHRFIDPEAQVDDDAETSEEDKSSGESYCNVVNIFTLI